MLILSDRYPNGKEAAASKI
jgi:hypothetical protein